MKKLFTMIVFCLAVFAASAQVNFLHSTDKQEDSFITELNIYPNPTTNGNISVKIDLNQQEEHITIKIFNLIGKTVYVQKITTFDTKVQENINLGTQPKGVYILEVSNGEKKEIRRLSYV